MAYTINKTDGSVVTTITDGTSDNTTSLTLFGKSFSGFGLGLNENLVKLLENAASTSAPSAPLKGELWFDTTTNQLKVYDGTSFKPTGGAKTSSTEPTSPSAGDLWHDSSNDQLFLYTGSAFLLVGPVFTSGQTLSGFQIETLASSGGNKVVASMYAGNTRVAILSKETFTPSVSQSGFAEIKAGFTLNSTLGAVFEGTNTQASAIDVSGTTNTSGTLIAGGNFLRAEVKNGGSGLGKEVEINLDETPFLNITWKVEKDLNGIDEKSKKGHDFAARVFVVKKTGLTPLSNKAINYVFSSNNKINEYWRSPYTKSSIDYVLSTTLENNDEWVTVKTNVKNDFKELHNLDVKILNGIAIMSDTDQSKKLAVSYLQNIYFSSN